MVTAPSIASVADVCHVSGSDMLYACSTVVVIPSRTFEMVSSVPPDLCAMELITGIHGEERNWSGVKASLLMRNSSIHP